MKSTRRRLLISLASGAALTLAAVGLSFSSLSAATPGQDAVSTPAASTDQQTKWQATSIPHTVSWEALFRHASR